MSTEIHQAPRWWRNKHPYLDMDGEECLNCDAKMVAIRRPVCPNCGVVFEPEARADVAGARITVHRIIGSEKKVVIIRELQIRTSTRAQIEANIDA